MTENVLEPAIDKSDWGDGPWASEPDRLDWEHAGLPCLALRNKQGGNWCGYAAVLPGHPLHRVGYSSESSALAAALERLKTRPMPQVELTMSRMLAMLSGEARPSPELVLDAHGGLTYSNQCSGRICHVAKPGEPDDVWWFGFDCAHAGDFQPAYFARYKDKGYPFRSEPYDHAAATAADDWNVEQYRTLDYVRQQVNQLAEQLAALGQPERGLRGDPVDGKG